MKKEQQEIQRCRSASSLSSRLKKHIPFMIWLTLYLQCLVTFHIKKLQFFSFFQFSRFLILCLPPTTFALLSWWDTKVSLNGLDAVLVSVFVALFNFLVEQEKTLIAVMNSKTYSSFRSGYFCYSVWNLVLFKYLMNMKCSFSPGVRCDVLQKPFKREF